MILFRLVPMICEGGGKGVWAKVGNDQWCLAWWISWGLPFWPRPQVIWKRMVPLSNCRTVFDFGIGWLLVCTRFVLQLRVQPDGDQHA